MLWKAIMEFPENRHFAFSIFDDTDFATVEKIKPVYDLLSELGILITKSVWVYPPHDHFKESETVNDPKFLHFVNQLAEKGFEINLHSVGSGSYSRAEIIEGYENFKKLFGRYPKIHVNHSRNPDNIYWNPQSRFVFPFGWMMRHLTKIRGNYYQTFSGEQPDSPNFWGDLCKQHIKYIRNFTFNGINTLKYDPRIPYIDSRKSAYSNYWFSSSDGHTVQEFNQLISPKNVDQLEREKGVCIVYTHFAEGFVIDGKLDATFEKNMRYLASKKGWFVPVSNVLDFLLEQKGKHHSSYLYEIRLSFLWLKDRIIKYHVHKR